MNFAPQDKNEKKIKKEMDRKGKSDYRLTITPPNKEKGLGANAKKNY